MFDFVTSLDPRVIAAIIGATVALLGFILTVRPQIRARHEELKLRLVEIEQRIDILQQDQLSHVLKARLEAYPKIWKLIVESVLRRRLDQKPFDKKWATQFIADLHQVNTDSGYLFSQNVYEKVHELRVTALFITQALEEDDDVSDLLVRDLIKVVVGSRGKLGLAGCIKDDLGSYSNASISVRGKTKNEYSLHDYDVMTADDVSSFWPPSSNPPSR